MKILIVLALTLIGRKVCMATDLVCTTGKADIIFVLDGSSSVGYEKIHFQQQFAANVSEAFKVGPADTRFGAVLFSTKSSTKILFDLDTHSNNAEISQALSKEPYPYGQTMTYLGLELALAMMSKARPNAAKVVIVITGGLSSSVPKAVQAAKDLKKTNVTVLAVGADKADALEMALIASKSEYTFIVGSYQLIKLLTNDVINKICQATGGNPHPPCPNGRVVGSQCLTFIGQEMTQADAAKRCVANNGTIFEVRTQAQYMILGDFADENGVKLWAGAEKAAAANIPKEWFDKGQHSCYKFYKCLQMQPNRKLKPVECSENLAFVCVN